MFEKMKNLAVKTVKKVENALAPMMATAVAMGITPEVYAYDTKDAVNDILDIVYDIFKYVGIVLTLWGAGAFIMAYRNEDAESKTRAVMSLVAGISLVSIKTLFDDMITHLLG